MRGQLSTLLLITTLMALSEASVPIKWPRYIFQPRFTTALEDIKALIHGRKDQLRRLFDHIDKIVFLNESFAFKSSLLQDQLTEFVDEPYTCEADGAELNTKNNMCYLLEVVDKKSWFEARQDCLLRGGDLAQPLYKDADIVNFFAGIQDGFLEVSDKDLYVGVQAVNTEGTNYAYQYLNGLILPNDDLSLWFDGSPGEPFEKLVATLAIPIEENTTTIQFTELDGSTEKRGYICQFDAIFKPSDSFIKEFFRGSSNDVLNLDVEFPDEEIAACLGEGQFPIGKKCYKYFDTCLPFLDAKNACYDDGGELAFPSLGPHSRFGGVLADKLTDSASPGTAIWINGEDNNSGRSVVFIVAPSCNDSGEFDEEDSEEGEDAVRPKGSSLVLLLPQSTPDDYFDNDEWHVALVGSSIPLPFLCQYKADWV